MTAHELLELTTEENLKKVTKEKEHESDKFEAYAYLNNKEEMLKNLEYAFKYAQKRDELQNEGKELTHESVLVKGYGYDLAKFNYSNELSHVELIKEQIKDSTSYNKYSNDPDFIRLINKY